MDVKLMVLEGPKAGHGITVKHKSFVIGRGEDCQLRARSDRISRRHCELIVSETTVLVRDLGGKIGTFVNGERVEGEQQLQPGDTLKVGPLRFEVVMSTPTQAEQRPKKRDKEPAAANTAEPNKPSAGDIDSWLSDDTSPTPTPERKPASPRRRVDPSVSSDEASSSTESTDSDGPQAGEENEDSDPKFGKLPTPPPKSANSRDAADEMLRRMRRGS